MIDITKNTVGDLDLDANFEHPRAEVHKVARPTSTERKRPFTQRMLVLFLLSVLALEMLARNRQILAQLYSPLTRFTKNQDPSISFGSSLTRPQDPVELAVAASGKQPEAVADVPDTGEAYLQSDVRDDWRRVIAFYLRDMPVELFQQDAILKYYNDDVNNAQSTCMLVRIVNGTAEFTERYGHRHGRAASAKYMIRRILSRKHASSVFRDLMFLVMLSDGHRPRVPTIGSARHWTNWELMLPAPLGNFRGHFQGWGTPLQGWDRYIRQHVTETHSEYTWYTKVGKAVFRGALAMQTYKLGSCNEQNGRSCEPATKWYQVNRGVLFVRAQERPDLFDVGFTSLKPKPRIGPDQFDEAPERATPIDFRDFQRFKYIVNCGSNQDWSERLRLQLYMNSAVIYHMAESQEFFTPLLKPWVHVIPTDLNMRDLARNVEWSIRHDAVVRKIIRNQNAFAKRYITEAAMQAYWEIALEEFAARQHVDSFVVQQ